MNVDSGGEGEGRKTHLLLNCLSPEVMHIISARIPLVALVPCLFLDAGVGWEICPLVGQVLASSSFTLWQGSRNFWWTASPGSATGVGFCYRSRVLF